MYARGTSKYFVSLSDWLFGVDLFFQLSSYPPGSNIQLVSRTPPPSDALVWLKRDGDKKKQIMAMWRPPGNTRQLYTDIWLATVNMVDRVALSNEGHE